MATHYPTLLVVDHMILLYIGPRTTVWKSSLRRTAMVPEAVMAAIGISRNAYEQIARASPTAGAGQIFPLHTETVASFQV
jgi:hypothetical protein